MNMKYEDILNMALNEEHYFSNEDLRVNRKYGFSSKEENKAA